METLGHALWSCPAARDVWLECHRKIKKSRSDEDEFINIIDHLSERLDAEEMELVVCTARQIWLKRNKVIFGDEFVAPSMVMQRARDQLEAHSKAEYRKEGLQERSHQMGPLNSIGMQPLTSI